MALTDDERRLIYNRYIKIFLLIGSILIFLYCFFGCLNSGFFSTKNPTEKSPIRTLTIETDVHQRDKLGKYLDAFSESHKLEVKTSFFTNKKFSGPFFYVMYGENLYISAYFMPDRKTSDISFFEETRDIPPRQEYLDEIYNDLKIYINEIPGVVILEEK